MEQYVHFSYKSIGNFVKLLATIQYEKTNSGRDIAIWHERFDNDDADELFEQFLYELFSEGKTLQIEDIELVTTHAARFLEKDEKAKEIRNDYIKRTSTYWVHFKVDNIVYPCEYAKHTETVMNICADYFKGFEDISVDYIKKFIRENFEIQSDNTTIEKISGDAAYICRTILICRELAKTE